MSSAFLISMANCSLGIYVILSILDASREAGKSFKRAAASCQDALRQDAGRAFGRPTLPGIAPFLKTREKSGTPRFVLAQRYPSPKKRATRLAIACAYL